MRDLLLQLCLWASKKGPGCLNLPPVFGQERNVSGQKEMHHMNQTDSTQARRGITIVHCNIKMSHTFIKNIQIPRDGYFVILQG